VPPKKGCHWVIKTLIGQPNAPVVATTWRSCKYYPIRSFFCLLYIDKCSFISVAVSDSKDRAPYVTPVTCSVPDAQEDGMILLPTSPAPQVPRVPVVHGIQRAGAGGEILITGRFAITPNSNSNSRFIHRSDCSISISPASLLGIHQVTFDQLWSARKETNRCGKVCCSGYS
jgi:hypothetical protein